MPQDSVAIVENFWREVWTQPQDPDAIDRLVHKDFVITSGGRDIVGREPFKAWVKDFQAKVHDFEFHVRTTSEIGDVRVTQIEKKGRQNRRVRIAFA